MFSMMCKFGGLWVFDMVFPRYMSYISNVQCGVCFWSVHIHVRCVWCVLHCAVVHGVGN
jgi:hypothetical protein